MDLKSGRPFWPTKSGLLGVYPPLRKDLRCDVAIIGGGISSALITHHLLEAGLDVVVLEKRDIAGGSTSASTALLQYEIDTPLHKLIKLIGKEQAERAYQICRDSIFKIEQLAAESKIDCDFQRKHSLYYASNRWHVSALKREYEARKAAGFQVDLLSQKEIEERFSFSAPAAIYSYEAGEVDAYRLTHALFAQAAERGARIFDRSEVTAWEPHSTGITLTSERGHRIEARKVIFAAGYEAQQYLRAKLVTFRSSYALVSEPLEEFTGWYERCLIWETARPYLYLRTTADGRAIIGGEDDAIDIPLKRDAMLPRKEKKLLKRFQALFPQIEIDVAFSWAGTFGETKDGLAYIGPIREIPNAFFAMGYGGNGITYSVVAAEILRDMLLKRANPDAEIFRLDR
jgi:Glycine/D-amino acid oxidases (deaminating)